MTLWRFLLLAAVMAWFCRDGARGQIAPASTGVVVQFTPEPMEVLRALGVRKIGMWTASACNGPNKVIIAPERFRLSAPQIRMIDNTRAISILERSRKRLWPALFVRIVKGAGIVAGGVAALKGVNPNIVAGIISGVGIADSVTSQAESELPSLEPFRNGLLDAPLTLEPGQCATRSFFAALQHGAAPFQAVIP